MWAESWVVLQIYYIEIYREYLKLKGNAGLLKKVTLPIIASSTALTGIPVTLSWHLYLVQHNKGEIIVNTDQTLDSLTLITS